MNEPIGATCKINWMDKQDMPFTRYISFGHYNDDDDTDEFGVPDVDIFYYCFSGEDELKTLMVDCGNDFIVLDYELEYEHE